MTKRGWIGTMMALMIALTVVAAPGTALKALSAEGSYEDEETCNKQDACPYEFEYSDDDTWVYQDNDDIDQECSSGDTGDTENTGVNYNSDGSGDSGDCSNDASA